MKFVKTDKLVADWRVMGWRMAGERRMDGGASRLWWASGLPSGDDDPDFVALELLGEGLEGFAVGDQGIDGVESGAAHQGANADYRCIVNLKSMHDKVLIWIDPRWWFCNN